MALVETKFKNGTPRLERILPGRVFEIGETVCVLGEFCFVRKKSDAPLIQRRTILWEPMTVISRKHRNTRKHSGVERWRYRVRGTRGYLAIMDVLIEDPNVMAPYLLMRA